MPKIQLQPILHTDQDQSILLRSHTNLQPKNVMVRGVGENHFSANYL